MIPPDDPSRLPPEMLEYATPPENSRRAMPRQVYVGAGLCAAVAGYVMFKMAAGQGAGLGVSIYQAVTMVCVLAAIVLPLLIGSGARR